MHTYISKVITIFALTCMMIPGANAVNLCRLDASVNVRSLNEFLDAQGTTSEFVPHVPDYVGWTDNPAPNPSTTFALIDYAGLANNYIKSEGGKSLGTKVTGTVVERTQGGRTEVHVRLFTTNALAWAFKLDSITDPFPLFFSTTPLAFGVRADDVLDNGAKPALAVTYFDVKFMNTGRCATLPDLQQLVNSTKPYQTPYSFTFQALAYGKSDGKPALLRVEQVCANDGKGQACGAGKEVVTIIPFG
jgi:hypothetical protein